ncbi:MAG: N,N'-diacetylchitobiose phosphorylase [Clostridia bacterium]|nr:N,N'-diacetylchitobiose phosphorylase [Clostridia bacterium]
MRYGHFDPQNKEYVITKPDTPAPWANYLGSPEYGAIISNNATGYSFAKSGAKGRIIRHRFNSISNDAPGRYVYIKDNETGEYWSGSWAPVCKPLDAYKSECRHGTGYTVISSEYKGIETETTYFVPLGAEHEVWHCKVTNNSEKPRNISVIGYCEFVNHNSALDDQIDLQCTLFLTRTKFMGNFMHQMHNYITGDEPKERFFGLAQAKIDSYCGSRDDFLGSYRGYGNPLGVEKGLGNQLNYCLNSCGALQSDIVLQPGESKVFTYLLGQHPEKEAAQIIARYEDSSLVEKQLNELKTLWHSRLSALEVKTPDEDFNNMVNVWNAYNCFMTFIWSRAASLIYCGLRNGYGYRDTVQDIQGIIHLAPEMAKEQIKFMLSAQTVKGAGLPLVKYTHTAGHENTPDDAEYVKETGHPSYRADDALWLFPTVYKYISESGDIAFLDEEILFADKNETATVYEHLKRAIKFTVSETGAHGLPANLLTDWNDALPLGRKGESTFVAFQLIYAAKLLRKYAEEKNDTDYIKYLDEICENTSKCLEVCWDEDRWIRGYYENGESIGKRADKEASMWLNPQSWSVISGCTDKKRAETVMESVERELATPYGALLMAPAYEGKYKNGGSWANKSSKENGGIFSQPQGWLILAETMLGHGNRAYKYWRAACPAAYNDRAELRTLEPYVHGQFIEGKDSPFAGRAHVHWLTGTASTVMVASVEGILGIKPESHGIVIDPCVPSDWKEFSFKKLFRGKQLNITVKNPNGSEYGVKTVAVNGEKIDGILITEDILKDTNNIIIEMN